MVSKKQAYENLQDVIKGYTAKATEDLSVSDVRSLISIAGLSGAYITNMLVQSTKEKQLQELEIAASRALAPLQGDYPRAQAKPKRGRKIEIWLDGIPKEIEL